MAAIKRVVLVTGGMGGLGEAICKKMAASGNTVVTTYSPSNKMSAQWLEEMKKEGVNFHAYPVAGVPAAAQFLHQAGESLVGHPAGR